MAQMHGDRLPAGKTVRALPASGGFHLCPPVAAAVDRGAEDLGQYQARPDHAPEDFLEGRRAWRLPESLLEICVVALKARRYREFDFRDVDRAPPDHLRACGLSTSAECIELLDTAARGIRSCRVTMNENAGTLVPFPNGPARFDAGARRAWPGRGKAADRSPARIYAGPCACPRCSACRLRCARRSLRSQRSRRAAGSGFQSGARPQGLSQASRFGTNTRSGFKASA